MTEIKRVILCGHGASGKDHLAAELIDAGYKFPISYTTRPPREGEIDGVHYRFTTESRFQEMISSDLMYEHVEYKDRGINSDETWYYGRTKQDFPTGNIMIMTPAGLVQLSEQDREESFIIFIDIDEDIRRERMNERIDADDTERRIKTDREDFDAFKNYDYRIDNPKFISSNIHHMLEMALRLFPEII
jgi:guanylate kinase